MLSFKINVAGFMLILMAFIIGPQESSADCIIDDQLLYDLKTKRKESCKEWPYNQPQLSRSSCQECVERLADVCWFTKNTPMSLDQKDELDGNCAGLKEE